MAAAFADSNENSISYILLDYTTYINKNASSAADWAARFNQNWTNCANATTLFGQRSSIKDCAVYPNISRDIRKGTFSKSADLTAHLIQNTTLAKDITTTISDCLIGLCASVQGCSKQEKCSTALLLLNDTTLSAEATKDCWYNICQNQTVKVNPDIAGIGITVSYFMQIAIALLGALLLYGLRQYENIPQRRAKKATTIEGKKPSFATRQIQILIFSMVEFHKAQCFFAMAVQAATLIFIFRKSDTYSTVDVYALLAIGPVGIVPVIGNLYALMRFGKSSWYIFFLSLCSWALSLAVAFNRTLGGKSDGYYWTDPKNYAREPAGPTSCGLVPTTALCAGISWNGSNAGVPASFIYVYLYPCLAPLALILILWQVGIWDLRPVGAFRAIFRKLPAFVRNKVFWIVMEHVCVLAIFGWALFCQIEIFAILFEDEVIDTENWGFGQIVGITIWFPTLVEYAYLQYYGIEEGAEYKYRAPVHVTTKSNDTATSSESSCTKACVHDHDIYTPDRPAYARAAQSDNGSMYQSLPLNPDIELEHLVSQRQQGRTP